MWHAAQLGCALAATAGAGLPTEEAGVLPTAKTVQWKFGSNLQLGTLLFASSRPWRQGKARRAGGRRAAGAAGGSGGASLPGLRLGHRTSRWERVSKRTCHEQTGEWDTQGESRRCHGEPCSSSGAWHDAWEGSFGGVARPTCRFDRLPGRSTVRNLSGTARTAPPAASRRAALSPQSTRPCSSPPSILRYIQALQAGAVWPGPSTFCCSRRWPLARSRGIRPPPPPPSSAT